MPGFEVFGEEERKAINDLFDANGGILFAHGFDETTWDGLCELPDVLASTPEEAVVSLDTAHFVSNLVLDALQDEERQVLILRHVQELSVAETAVQMNMTEDQVKKRTQRAISHAYRVAQERGLLHDLS